MPENIICCICPSIRKCHFEVDKDVKEQFENEFKDINISNSIEIMDKQLNKEKWNIDTVLINKILLKKEGLIEENIIDSGICSMCNSDIIHSFRVEKRKLWTRNSTNLFKIILLIKTKNKKEEYFTMIFPKKLQKVIQ